MFLTAFMIPDAKSAIDAAIECLAMAGWLDLEVGKGDGISGLDVS